VTKTLMEVIKISRINLNQKFLQLNVTK